MIKKGILLIENDWRFTEFMAESAKKEGLTLDQASDGMEAVQFLQREKRKYVCILLDGKFPIWNPTPKVPSELEEFGTLHEKDNPTKLTGLTLLRYLREKKWQKDGVLWVLTSTTFNSYLNEELKDWGVVEKDIVYAEDKHYRGPQQLEEDVFSRIKGHK